MANQRRKDKKTRSTINWWKWAFIGLIVLLFLLFFQLMRSIQPVTINEPNMETINSNEEEMVFTAAASKEDTEQFLNTYLASTLGESYEGYSIVIDDQLEINGNLEVFSFTVPFTLSFDPFVLENGNVQLRADSVELGSLSLPVGAVLSLLSNQLEVPYFVAIDSEQEVVVINLNEFNQHNDIAIQMVRIDLPEDDIQMNLSIDEEMIIENFENNGN